MSIKKEYQYQRTARYFLSDEPSSHHRYLCYVLHGHGHLPQYFLRKFAAAERSDILFVAPEGLHRYYLQGNSGRVGASWMTKEERLQDIEDYCQMLDLLAEKTHHLQPFEKRAILGFSQGVATACRWKVNSRFQFDELINWAGAFPPDLNYDKAFEDLENIPVHLVLGKQDEFISQAMFDEHCHFLQKQKIKFKTHFFQGKHEIETAMLKKILQEVF